MTTFSQRDLRWSRKKLGFSNLTIGTHGCTITAFTQYLNRVFGYSLTPDQVNDKLKTLGNYSTSNNKGAFQGALLVWGNVYRVFPEVKFIKRARNYNNVEVAFQVYFKRNPVLVEVYAGKIGAPRHWVLFIGGGKMIDPWTGNISPTSTYPPIGYSIFARK